MPRVVRSGLIQCANPRATGSVKEIQEAKHRMVKRWFSQPLFGVEARDVILNVACMDSELSQAYGVLGQARSHILGSKFQDELFKFLERAKKCKQTLETDLRNANRAAKVGTTITTKVGPPVISGGGG